MRSNVDPTIIKGFRYLSGYIAFTNGDDEIQILSSSLFGFPGYWSLSSIYNNSSHIYKTKRKIGLAWHPYDSVSAPTGLGFLVAGYVEIRPGESERARVIYFQDGGTSIREGLLGNTWTIPNAGIEFLSYEGDTNMKASFHNTKIDEFNNVIPQLHYYPIADGIFDY